LRIRVLHHIGDSIVFWRLFRFNIERGWQHSLRNIAAAARGGYVFARKMYNIGDHTCTWHFPGTQRRPVKPLLHRADLLAAFLPDRPRRTLRPLRQPVSPSPLWSAGGWWNTSGGVGRRLAQSVPGLTSRGHKQWVETRRREQGV
jgi:hypothetical protein